jgi:poly(3-hydroxybutyrate) depolymerase
VLRVAKGEASDHDKHNKFYDEYLAVMDMTAEFYLSTVERIFKGLEIAQNRFTVDGKRVDIGKITTVAVKTVEGGKDDISAPGQCVAALDLCTGLPDRKRPITSSRTRAITASSRARAGATTSVRWCSTSSTPIATCRRRR